MTRSIVDKRGARSVGTIIATAVGMGQKPPEHTPSRSSARVGTGFETGARHRAHMGGLAVAPASAQARKAGSPFHSKPAAKKSVPRRNPKLMFAGIAGLIAILALAFGMLFSGPTFVDEGDTEQPTSMQFEAGR